MPDVEPDTVNEECKKISDLEQEEPQIKHEYYYLKAHG